MVLYDCVIIGAGISGLVAARTLRKAGITNILVLEARNRIGGRLNFTNFGPYTVDIGGHFIHGHHGNKVFTFAKERNLIAREDSHFCSADHFFTPDGVKMPLQSAQSFMTECNNAMIEIFGLKTSTSAAATVADVFNEVKSKLNFANDTLTSKQKSALFNLRTRLQSVDMASSSAEFMSLKGIRDWEDCAGPYYVYLKDGYSSVITELVKELPENIIRLDSPVANIDWSDKICKITLYHSALKPITSKFVISTVPLGCLKQVSDTLFSPPLSDDKLKAIAAMGVGNNNRILLRFSRRWWPKEVSSMFVAWPEDEMSNQEPLPCQNKQLYENKGDMQWFRYLFGFKSEHSSGPEAPILLTRLPGYWASVTEKLPDEEIRRVCWEVLKNAVGRHFDNIEEPVAIIRSKWGSDPYARGCYSNLPLGSSAALYNVLAAPLPSEQEPRLLFAGEATHSRFYATTHGAWESGEREAGRVLQHLNNPNKPKL